MNDQDDTGEVQIYKPELVDQQGEVLRPELVDDDEAWQRSGTDTGAMLALGLAVLSFVVLPIVGSIAALFVAPGAKKRIRYSDGRLRGMNLARAAQVLAVLNFFAVAAVIYLVFWVLGWVWDGVADVLENPAAKSQFDEFNDGFTSNF